MNRLASDIDGARRAAIDTANWQALAEGRVCMYPRQALLPGEFLLQVMEAVEVPAYIDRPATEMELLVD